MRIRLARLSRASVLPAGPLLVALLVVAACTRQDPTGPAAPGSAPEVAGSVLAASAASSAPTAVSVVATAAPAPPPIRMPQLADGAPDRAIDLHVDTPWMVHFKGRPATLPKGHATPDKLRKGRYAGLVFPIYIPDYIHDNHPRIADADAIYDTIDAIVAANELLVEGLLGQPTAASVSVFVSIEGAGAFAEDVTQIDRFIARGVRLVGPVHARDNRLASSATGKSKGKLGLTDLGKELCNRVYRAGALVDVSHMSDAAFADLVPIAAAHQAPVVATHSNARALAKHPRNLTDEQLRIIGETGGVVGLNLHRPFVRSGAASLKHAVAQVQHMVEVAGIDHVAIGSDFDGGRPIAALEDSARLPSLAKALLEAGRSEEDVRKIFSLNALRVLSWGLADGAGRAP